MYNPKVIQWRIEAIEKALKVKIKLTDVAKVDEMRLRLEGLLTSEGSLSRDLMQEEADFIRNERLLVKCDFRYWTDRYATFQKDGSEGGGVGRVKFWASQEAALKIIAKIELENWEAKQRGEAVDGICVVMHKARQLGACQVAGTKVLTALFEWKPIETIKIGDEVIAVDEYPSGGKGIARKMRKAMVINTCSMPAPTHRILIDDGTVFRTTFHHKFLCKKPGTHSCVWIEAQNIRPGDKIRRVTRLPDHASSYEDGWFSGFMDGEGSLRARDCGGAELCVSQVAGDALERAKAYLTANNIKFRVEADSRKAGESSKLGTQIVYKLTVNNMGDILRLLSLCRPSRFIHHTFYEGKELPNNLGEVWGTVLESGASIVNMVYDIETTASTYTAEGFVSHNTALSRTLGVHRMTNYRHIRGMAASIDDDKIQELYDRDKLCIDNLPFYLAPSIGYDVKASHLYFDKLDSRVLYQQSNQQSGLGQGRQFDLAHLTECAFWPYPDKMIELDFFPTLPLGINTMCILESTANGMGGWWYDFTEDVRRGLQRRWRYIFAPWYIEPRKNRAHPPETWNPSEMTMRHAKKVYETSNQYAGKDVLLDREQLYWYETERAAALRRGKLNLFLTNYCATPEESFQFTGQAQFSVEVLERIRLGTINPHYYEVNIPQS